MLTQSQDSNPSSNRVLLQAGVAMVVHVAVQALRAVPVRVPLVTMLQTAVIAFHVMTVTGKPAAKDILTTASPRPP